MTAERYLYVAFPIHARQWCNARTAVISIVIVGIFSVLLQMVFPITRIVERVHTSCPNQSVVFHILVREGWGFQLYEKIYHWMNSLLVIVLPTLLLIIFSTLIIYEFVILWKFENKHPN